MGSTPFTSIPTMSENFPDTEAMDPDLAALLDDDILDDDTSDLFALLEDEEEIDKYSEQEPSLTESFPAITQFEQEPDPVFLTKDYYSRVLHGEGDTAQTMHELLLRFIKQESTQEGSDLRLRLTNAWWSLAHELVENYRRGNIQKRWALRFGYILPNLITENQRQMLARVVADNDYAEPIHYMDEWLDMVAKGTVNPLATDEELTPRRKSDKAQLEEQMNRNKGLYDASHLYLRNSNIKRESYEQEILTNVKQIVDHIPHHTLKDVKDAYSQEQKRNLNRISRTVQDLLATDREIASHIRQLEKLAEQRKSMEQAMDNSDGEEDNVILENSGNEFTTLKQLIKLSVGRQGNHFPFLLGHYIPSNINLISTRENVIVCMKDVEEIDPDIFKRTFKRHTNRIVPHTIIVPCYGDKGICWEPYERFKRATSRGRIAIPLFPKDVKIAVVYALGDLRWNVAKEEAAQYWMNEGLTGMYYQWYMQNNRGDAKKQFLEDYYLWVTKEVDGIQKLDNEVRSIFWRYIPFKQSVKDILRDRGYVYNELYRKDMNRLQSDGY